MNNTLSRYKDLLVLIWKYGMSDLFDPSKLDTHLPESETHSAKSTPSPEEFARDLAAMGPAFIKFGQLLSTRPDILPPPYLEALTYLQDKCEPFDFEQVQQIIEGELGVKINKAFASFEKTPIASASLGQVHKAELHDGRLVAVKVQRPQVRKQVLADIDSLQSAATLLEKTTEIGKQIRFVKVMNHFRKVLLKELDYRQEARHLSILSENLKNFPLIVVPEPVDDYSTDKVLTMDFIKGKKATSISPLRMIEIDGDALAGELFRAYLKQLVDDGFMHADPHPGNVHLTDDNRIALLDLGMVAHIPYDFQERYLRLLLALSDGRSKEVYDEILKVSSLSADADERGFRLFIDSLVADQANSQMSDMKTGRMVLQMIRGAAQHGFLLPVELSMVGKTLLNLDQIARTLAPSFDPNQAIQEYAADLLKNRMLKTVSPSHLFSRLLETKNLVATLPENLNKIVTKVADNEIEIKVKAIDEQYLMEGFQKIANRITLGIILAALIIGAAMMMNIKSTFTIMGYPGLATIFFLVAAAGGIILAYRILFHDESTTKR